MNKLRKNINNKLIELTSNKTEQFILKIKFFFLYFALVKAKTLTNKKTLTVLYEIIR